MPTIPPPPVLLRPAIIEMRYQDKPHFEAAVELYSSILTYSEAFKPKGVDTVYVFKVGLLENHNRKDIMLRLTYPLKGPKPAINGQTFVYWYIQGADMESLNQAYAGIGVAATQEEPPATYPYQVREQPAAPIRGRSLLKITESDSYLGLTINPPVPTINLGGIDEGISFASTPKKRGLTEIISYVLLGLLGLGGGAAIYSLGLSRERKKAYREWQNTGKVTL